MTDEEQRQVRELVQALGIAFVSLMERIATLEKIISWGNLLSPEIREVARKMSEVETAEIRKHLLALGEHKAFEDILKNFEGPPQ